MTGYPPAVFTFKTIQFKYNVNVLTKAVSCRVMTSPPWNVPRLPYGAFCPHTGGKLFTI